MQFTLFLEGLALHPMRSGAQIGKGADMMEELRNPRFKCNLDSEFLCP